MRGVGPLPPPGLEDAELSGDLEHPLQQALLRATGQKTVSKLAEDTKVKARVGQLEAKKVLPVDPRPDRLSRLSIAQALAELHQRDQGQPPGWAGWLTLLGIEVGEVAILEDRPKRVAQGEIGTAFGKGGASDAGGLFGHTWERLLRLERHSEASRDYRTNAALDLPSHPFANGILSHARHGRPAHKTNWVSDHVTLNQQLGSADTTAQVHPGRFTTALMRAAEAHGAELRVGEVTGVLRDRSGARVTGVRLGDEIIEGDAVVIAMGPWSILAAR